MQWEANINIFVVAIIPTVCLEITDYQIEKDKMATLQKHVALLEEDVKKEKDRTAGNVNNVNHHII